MRAPQLTPVKALARARGQLPPAGAPGCEGSGAPGSGTVVQESSTGAAKAEPAVLESSEDPTGRSSLSSPPSFRPKKRAGPWANPLLTTFCPAQPANIDSTGSQGLLQHPHLPLPRVLPEILNPRRWCPCPPTPLLRPSLHPVARSNPRPP